MGVYWKYLVSSCKCWILVSRVHPVAILRAAFCIFCTLFMLVCEIIGSQIVFAYSKMGRVIALYVWSMISFCLPHLVDVRAVRMLRVRFALSVMILIICSEYVDLEPNVRPKIFGCFSVGIILLFT